MTKPRIAMLHSLARSGGTLVSRCIGSIPGNIVLSEIHPRWSFHNPLAQANEWFGLVSTEELARIAAQRSMSYIDAIELVRQRCEERGKRLLIRDWTHVDFTPGQHYPVQPVYEFSQMRLLEQAFEIDHVALTRDPLDAYLSVSRVDLIRDWLTLPVYLDGYRRFAELAAGSGFVRYEDFCADPETVLADLCARLGLFYDDRFTEWYPHYTKMTGDIYGPEHPHTITGDPVGARAGAEIRLPPRRPEYTRHLDALRDNADYARIIELLGYAPAWEHDG